MDRTAPGPPMFPEAPRAQHAGRDPPRIDHSKRLAIRLQRNLDDKEKNLLIEEQTYAGTERRSTHYIEEIGVELPGADSKELISSLMSETEWTPEASYARYIDVPSSPGLAVWGAGPHRGRLPLRLGNKEAMLTRSPREGALLSVTPGVELRGQQPEKVVADLGNRLGLLSEDWQEEGRVVRYTLAGLIQGIEPWDPLAPPGGWFVDTRARRMVWLRRGGQLIGFVCGSKSGGVEVELLNEARPFSEDYDLEATVLATGGFDPELPIRKLSLTVHGPPLLMGGRRSVKAWPSFLREAVGATDRKSVV